MSQPLAHRVNFPQLVTGMVLAAGVPVLRGLLPLELRVHVVTRVIVLGLVVASVLLVIAARSWDAVPDETR